MTNENQLAKTSILDKKQILIKLTMKYTKSSTLEAVLKHAQAPQILEKYNVPCLGCAFARAEMDKLTLGAICEMYGLDIKGILDSLNANAKANIPNIKSKAKKKK
ncbi:MAG: hypothetical protein WC449_00770 [Candidatus Paceibacterota bacterium]